MLRNNKSKYVGILIILLLSGFITTSFVSYFVARDSISSHIESTTLPLTSDNIYSEIQRDLLNPIFISSLMAQDTFVRDWILEGELDVDEIVRYLTEIQTQNNTVISFFISEKSRNYYYRNGILKQVKSTDPQDLWYFRMKDLDRDYEINVDVDMIDNSSVNIFINYKVFDYKGNFIGVTGVGLAVKSVKNMINTYQSRFGREVYFVDRDGEITLTGGEPSVSNNIRREVGISSIADQILNKSKYSGSYKKGGKSIYLNSRLVNEFGWYLIVEQIADPSEGRILRTLVINLSLSMVITIIVLLLANLTLGGYQKKLEEMATTDSLTGVANRQVFEMMFVQTLKLCLRRDSPLSAIMFDIDHFKSINDNYGHLAGDLVLKEIIGLLLEDIRDTDTLCRWGGDEFLLLLSDCKLEKAFTIAEKLRKMIEKHQILYHNKNISLTASFGVGQIGKNDTQKDFINKIDEQLYRAKDNGRNKVEKAET